MPTENNVLIMHFPENSQAFEALSQLKSQPGVTGAAVVERTPDGEVRLADAHTPEVGGGVAVGGLVGSLIGILAGPVGMLLGWSTGMLVGMAYETDEAADADDGFTILSRSVPAGGNALIVEMTETSHTIVDDVAEKLNGTVTRLPAAEVQAEVESAREAARQAATQARKVRRANRRAEFKEKMSGLGRPRPRLDHRVGGQDLLTPSGRIAVRRGKASPCPPSMTCRGDERLGGQQRTVTVGPEVQRNDERLEHGSSDRSSISGCVASHHSERADVPAAAGGTPDSRTLRRNVTFCPIPPVRLASTVEMSKEVRL